MRIQIHIAALIAGAALATATPAYALLVQPIVIDLTTTGPGSSAAITVTNDRNRSDSIEVTISKLTLPEKGAPVLTPDPGNDFLIFPPASTIDPGKTQVFRVRWIGDPAIPESKTYYFAVSELPVNQLQGSGVQILYSIQTLVTVTLPDLKPNLSVASVQRDIKQVATRSTTSTAPTAGTVRPTPGVSITFSNSGNAIDYISRYQIKLNGGNWSKTFDGPEVNRDAGLGLMPPNSKRTFFFPVSDLPQTGELGATFSKY